MSAVLVRRSFVVAPVALLAGVLAMKFGWKPNPGLDWGVALPLWTGAHLAYVLGYLAFGVVLVALWSWARGTARSVWEHRAVDAISVVGAVGLVAMLGQMVIDLIVGFTAQNRAAMSGISQSFHDLPGVDALFYGTIPAMQLTATALLIILLVARRAVDGWVAAVFVAGSLCIATGMTALMVLGGVALCAAMTTIAQRPIAPHSPASATVQ
jgi:hypothetical protein